LPGGDRGYTRNGHLTVDAASRLTQDGRAVLDSAGVPIAVPRGASVRIAPDGAVLADGAPVARLGLFHLSGAVDRIAPSVLAPSGGGRAEPVEAQVRPGELELGNSGPLEAMVQLIAAQRQFDASMQALQTYRSLDGRSSELGRIR
jgi:flagellar basal-body rod protein FlgF